MSDATVTEFLDRTTMRSLINIPDEVLDQAMAVAYQAYRAGQYAAAETLCKGLIAADHRYWWAYSLYGATLLKLGRKQEALVQVDRGLRYEPGQTKLLAMKREILANPTTDSMNRDASKAFAQREAA